MKNNTVCIEHNQNAVGAFQYVLAKSSSSKYVLWCQQTIGQSRNHKIYQSLCIDRQDCSRFHCKFEFKRNIFIAICYLTLWSLFWFKALYEISCYIGQRYSGTRLFTTWWRTLFPTDQMWYKENYWTHCGLVTTYGDIDPGQHWRRYRLVTGWHQANT